MSDDLSPGVWPIVRSRGDGFTPTAFSVEVDDIPVVVTGALAHRDIMVAEHDTLRVAHRTRLTCQCGKPRLVFMTPTVPVR